ncbi:hypothetical protein H4R19_005308, partial [Coemansia spiralis]
MAAPPLVMVAPQGFSPPLAAGYSQQQQQQFYHSQQLMQQQHQPAAFSYPMAPGSPPFPHMGFAAAGAPHGPLQGGGFAMVGGQPMTGGSPPTGAGYAYYAASASPSGSPPVGPLMVGRSADGMPMSAHFIVGDMAAMQQQQHARLVHSPPMSPTYMFPGSVATEELDSRNVYIRNLPENCTDEVLERMAQPYGDIESSKSIIYEPTGKCRGYGFVMYRTEMQAQAAIEAFNAMGLHATLARDSIKAKLKRLQDRNSTNVYVSNLPVDVDEDGLVELLRPHRVVSVKILRDSHTGQHRSVGFARMEDRETAMLVIDKLKGMVLPNAPGPLSPRIADSADQKRLKQFVGAAATIPRPADDGASLGMRSGAASPVMWSPVLVYTPAGSPPPLMPLPAPVHAMDYVQRMASPQMADHPHYQGYALPQPGYMSP